MISHKKAQKAQKRITEELEDQSNRVYFLCFLCLFVAKNGLR